MGLYVLALLKRAYHNFISLPTSFKLASTIIQYACVNLKLQLLLELIGLRKKDCVFMLEKLHEYLLRSIISDLVFPFIRCVTRESVCWNKHGEFRLEPRSTPDDWLQTCESCERCEGFLVRACQKVAKVVKYAKVSY